MLKNILLVAFGGSLGSVCRYLVGYFFSKNYPSSFPLGTFSANILGCFIIGLIYGLATKNAWLTPEWRLLLTTGFCGGFTTFSSFANENVHFLNNADYQNLFLYTFLSILLGFTATWLGMMLAK